MLENGLYKKMIPQFDCTYYLALNLNSYSNILSIHIVVKSAGETKKNVGVPAPGLLEKYNFPWSVISLGIPQNSLIMYND